MIEKRPSVLSVCFAAVLMLALNGCGFNISDAKPTGGRDPTVAEAPSADETVRGEDDPPIVTLDIGSALREHRLSEGEELPGNIIIPTTNLNAVPVTAALQAVLAGTDVSMSWDTGTLGDRLVTVVNLSGPLPKVVKQICAAAKVFCNFRHGTMELADKDTFIVSLPPVAKTAGANAAAAGGVNSMVESINELIGGKVQVDDQGGNLIYTTDVEGEEHVKLYLQQLRNGRPLVVLQLYVWEVTLSKENGSGIQWNKFQLTDFGPTWMRTALNIATNNNTFQGSSGGVSLGAVTKGQLNTDSLLSFLATQGHVQTISNPQVTFISGSNATLKVGGKQRYISQVGTTTNNTSGTSNTSTNNSTINTDSIETGLTVDAAGTYENGIVLASLELSLTNLVGLNPTTTNGVTIDLPETTDEKINTTLRVRPGDNLVLAGLVRSSDVNNRQGIPLPGVTLPSYSDDQAVNKELVVVVKPSVILFSDAASRIEEKKKQDNQPMPAPVLINKDGAKPLASPMASGQPGTPLSAMPTPSEYIKPELMQPAPAPMPTPAAFVPSEDGAPVDRLMMQKGFSHAFDDMQQPMSLSPSSRNEHRP